MVSALLVTHRRPGMVVSGSDEGYWLERRNAEAKLVAVLVVAAPRRAVTATMRRMQADATLRQWAAKRR